MRLIQIFQPYTGCQEIGLPLCFQTKNAKNFLARPNKRLPGQFRLFFSFRTVEQLLSLCSRPNTVKKYRHVFRSQLSFDQTDEISNILAEAQLAAEDKFTLFLAVWS
jgi:hypothetical protein